MSEKCDESVFGHDMFPLVLFTATRGVIQRKRHSCCRSSIGVIEITVYAAQHQSTYGSVSLNRTKAIRSFITPSRR